MAQKIVHNYKTLVETLGELIKISGYRNDYIAKKIDMKAANFSQKKQRGNWSADEVQKIMDVIDNEEVEDYLLLQLMRASKNEETISSEEFKKRMGWS